MKHTIVDRVIAAIADNDIVAFVGCYTEDATIEDGHDNVIARGHDELRARYGPMLEQHPEIEIHVGGGRPLATSSWRRRRSPGAARSSGTSPCT